MRLRNQRAPCSFCGEWVTSPAKWDEEQITIVCETCARETLAKLGAAPAEVLHVGDRLDADVRGAAEVGMATAWITRRVKHVDTALERYDGPAPTYTISDLEELLPIVG